MASAQPLVTPVGDALWRVFWQEGDRLIDNTFVYPDTPVVLVTTEPNGSTVLVTDDGVEVGRYNTEWAGAEVPCEDAMDPQPVDD